MVAEKIFGTLVSQWQNPNCNANVAYLNDLKDVWNSNFNWSDNDFNDNWRWLVVGNLLSFPAKSGVFSN